MKVRVPNKQGTRLAEWGGAWAKKPRTVSGAFSMIGELRGFCHFVERGFSEVSESFVSGLLLF
jgi:hypothetical protein